MKVFGIILIIFGSILIVLNLIFDFSTPGPGTRELVPRIAYYIGFNFIAILGGIFLWIGLWLEKKARKRKPRHLVDQLFQNEAGEKASH